MASIVNNIWHFEYYARKKLDYDGHTIVRNNRTIVETIGYQFHGKLDNFKIENDLYIKRLDDFLMFFYMLTTQLKDIKRVYDKDINNRHMIIQFDKKYHYERGRNNLPCMESIILLFDLKQNLNIIINLRSSDINKLTNDMLMIFTLINIVAAYIGFNIKYGTVSLQIASLHEYMV